MQDTEAPKKGEYKIGDVVICWVKLTLLVYKKKDADSYNFSYIEINTKTNMITIATNCTLPKL